MPEVREATPEEIARYQEASKFVSHKVKAVRKRQAGHPIMEGVCRCGHRFALAGHGENGIHRIGICPGCQKLVEFVPE